eukprot:362319-Chlamydomonas_euryale.AAC.1
MRAGDGFRLAEALAEQLPKIFSLLGFDWSATAATSPGTVEHDIYNSPCTALAAGQSPPFTQGHVLARTEGLTSRCASATKSLHVDLRPHLSRCLAVHQAQPRMSIPWLGRTILACDKIEHGENCAQLLMRMEGTAYGHTRHVPAALRQCAAGSQTGRIGAAGSGPKLGTPVLCTANAQGCGRKHRAVTDRAPPEDCGDDLKSPDTTSHWQARVDSHANTVLQRHARHRRSHNCMQGGAMDSTDAGAAKPVQTAPAQPPPAQTAPVQSTSVQSTSVRTRPVQTAPVQSTSVQRTSVRTKKHVHAL